MKVSLVVVVFVTFFSCCSYSASAFTASRGSRGFSHPKILTRERRQRLFCSDVTARGFYYVDRRSTSLATSLTGKEEQDESEKNKAATVVDSSLTSDKGDDVDASGGGGGGRSGISDSGGVMRTLLLAVPLFCKFVVVLAIKFVTDLVVFPLLLLYRIARLTKRRIVASFKSLTSRSRPKSGEEDFDGIAPNGSTPGQ